jgi:GT2 family glycosyltransferase
MIARTNVVILCYNALPYTKATLSSLFEKTDSDYTLTIINNGSNSDTKEFLENLVVPGQCKEYTLVNNAENMGSTFANNQAFTISQEKGMQYTCFCNNDLYFSTGWLRRLEQCLDENPNIAMVNPLRPSTRTLFSSNTLTMDRLSSLEETSDYRKELEDFTGMSVDSFDDFSDTIVNVNNTNPSNPVEIIRFPDALSTCVCLVNNDHIAKLDHFAKPIFTSYGGEDIDTSWRVMQAGYDCAVLKNVYVHHFRGKSLKSNKLNRQALIRASNQRLYGEWMDEISAYLIDCMKSGIDMKKRLETDTNNDWLLSQLNKDVDLFKNLYSRKDSA